MSHTTSPLSIQNKPTPVWLVFFIGILLLVSAWYIGLRFGAVSFSHVELMETLRHPFTSTNNQDILIDIRLPRMVAAMLVGAAMAQAGAIMQGVTRNPIADPGLLGINAGAGFALVMVYALLPAPHYSVILLTCFTGAVLASLLVFGLSYQPQKGFQQLRLILVGAMVATLFQTIGQALTVTLNLSTAIIGWQAGGLAGTNWAMVQFMAPFVVSGLILAQLFAYPLTVLSLDETVAQALGQKTTRLRLLLFGVVLLLSAASVALVGSIAFVGLIIPHALKLFVPHNYRLLLPLAALFGADFVLWVDIACRTLHPPYETPLTALVSMVGLPCFLWLIRKGRHL